MASRDISHTEDNQQPVIAPPVKPTRIGDNAKKEKKILERGMVSAGDPDDRKSNKLEIRKTVELFKRTTYWGYALMTFAIVMSGFLPSYFHIDPWVLVVLVGGVISNNIFQVLKQLSGSKIFDSTPF